eukprot:GHVU01211204.1.p1 GENE.GHVU01211204.1~~GHVU01211204.1.p1  ORF type:complete len:135 (-),score=8.07 GHVU01211204.1:456-824(-)
MRDAINDPEWRVRQEFWKEGRFYLEPLDKERPGERRPFPRLRIIDIMMELEFLSFVLSTPSTSAFATERRAVFRLSTPVAEHRGRHGFPGPKARAKPQILSGAEISIPAQEQQALRSRTKHL